MTSLSILGVDARVWGDTKVRMAHMMWVGVQAPRKKEMDDTMMCLGVANRLRLT